MKSANSPTRTLHMDAQTTQRPTGAAGSLRPGGHRRSLLSLALLMLLLPLLVLNTSLALKLPTFLSSWRPTQSPSLSGGHQQLANQINLPQETLMTSASVVDLEARPRFSALTRTQSHQHHHMPLHLFRSFPKSLFGRFLPASLSAAAAPPTAPPATKTSTDASSAYPMLFDWSQLNVGGAASPAGATFERNPMMMMSPQQPPLSQQHQPPQSPFSNVYHFQATQPLQANHFNIDHDQQQQQQEQPPPSPHQDSQPELQKHALGYGDNGEEFATVMAAAEPQASGQQQDIQTIQVGVGETVQATNETANWPPPAKVDQKHETQQPRDNSNSSGLIVLESGNANNNGSSSDDLLQLSDERRPQQANQSANRSNSSTLLTNLIGEELTRLKQEPDELNKTLSSMGQPLLALLMDESGQPDSSGSKLPLSHQDNSSSSSSSSDAAPFVEPPAQMVENAASNRSAPESGRSESAARAVVAVPPSQEADEIPEMSASSSGDQHEFVAASDSDAVGSNVFSASDGDDNDHLESFILGPFRGFTSDNSIANQHHHEQSAAQMYNSAPRMMQQQQPQQPLSVGMSMASNLIQQARSLIQLPFANGPASQVTHTPPASHHQQQQAAAANRGEPRHTAGLFRGQQQVAYLASMQPDQLVEQATSPTPFSFAMTNNNYQRPQQATYQQARPPAWQQQQQSANYPSGTMMMPNHAIPHNNQQQQQQQQHQRRPKNPFGFNRYFLMPSPTMASMSPAHLRHQQQQHHSYATQQPSRQQQVSAKNVPYFAAEQQQQLLNHVSGGGQEQRPQTGDSDNNKAAGFQLANQQDNSFGLEQARKKFKSGLYQIEPPRLVNDSAADQTRTSSDQHPAASAADEQQQLLRQEFEQQEVDSAAVAESESNDDDDNEQLQLASSGANSDSSNQQQQQPKLVEFAAKQVGASIGVQPASNQSTSKSHKGKVFNEPVSSLLPLSPNKAKQDDSKAFRPRGASPNEGQSVSQTKTLKHSEEVTLYEFDSAPQTTATAPPATGSAAQPSAKAEQRRPSTPAITAVHQNPQQPRELLETQVFTVPYTITMQPDGQVSHFVAPPAQRQQQQARMRPNNNFVQHREPPFAHSFIRSTWAHPSAAAAAQRYFPPAARAAQLPQLQYLAPPAVETVSRQNQQQQQLFKSVFQEAQQASQVPMAPQRALDQWTQPPLRSVPNNAFVPQQQHYFHYQPLQQPPNLAQEPRQQPNQQQQVVFELANQSPRQASRPLEQQQFAVAINHSGGLNGNSVFSSSLQSIGDHLGAKLQQDVNPFQQQQTTTTTTTTQPPSSTAAAGSLTTVVSTTFQPATDQANERGAEQAEPTSSPPTREDDDDDKAEKLAHLRSTSFNQQLRQQQQQPQQDQQQPSSPSAFCANRAPGLYADESQKCKAYYQCAPTGHQMFRCNNQTQFNQKTQNCDWWYNVNCAGQTADSELLPQSEPLQRPQQATSAETDAIGGGGGETAKSSAASESNSSEPQSLSALSPLEDSQTHQQVAPQKHQKSSSGPLTSSSRSAMMEEHNEDLLGGPAPSSSVDQSASSAQQQPAPTSSTPIYGSPADQQNGSAGEAEAPASTGTSSSDYSARSTTTQDPIFLQPTTTTTTTTSTSTLPTTTTIATSTPASGDEVQPQVGAQLNETPEQQVAGGSSQQHSSDTAQIAFSSSTSISSGPDEAATTLMPTSADNRASLSKLSVRSLSGPLERASVPAGRTRAASSQRGGEKASGATIYSTSANQGSVSYTPMDTHQLTARAFQTTAAAQADHSAASGPAWLHEPQQQQTRRPPLEKRFGARLQSSSTTTTTDSPRRLDRVH